MTVDNPASSGIRNTSSGGPRADVHHRANGRNMQVSLLLIVLVLTDADGSVLISVPSLPTWIASIIGRLLSCFEQPSFGGNHGG